MYRRTSLDVGTLDLTANPLVRRLEPPAQFAFPARRPRITKRPPVRRRRDRGASGSASSGRGLPDSLDDARRRVALLDRNADHASAAILDGIAPDDRVSGPVSPLHQHVG